MKLFLKPGDQFSLQCLKCGSTCYIDPETAVEDNKKLKATVVCTNKMCQNRMVMEGTIPGEDHLDEVFETQKKDPKFIKRL
jgi:hypothetical protein